LTHQPRAPGPRFNFAQHLIERNAEWPDKTAYIDDRGSISYGVLAEMIQRCAAALLASGVRREERVLLLMHDCIDWPIGFLGAMYAGIVPVAVNTLLTAADYAYMLRHSRAQAALVSAELLPTLREAMEAAAEQGGHELRTVIVSDPEAALPPDAVAFGALLGQHEPLPAPADTGPDDPGFWLYSSGSTGRPKGALHSHANPYWQLLNPPLSAYRIDIARKNSSARQKKKDTAPQANIPHDFGTPIKRGKASGLLNSNGCCCYDTHIAWIS
jgi:benzoate-CoA ligase